MKKVTSIPNASRMFDALRSLGYDLNSSVADIVDNSITPKVGATKIQVLLSRDNNHFKLRIIDNGYGMSESDLEEAMRLGSDTTYKQGDLGKFGLGMKTASLSHCNILTVISKNTQHEITAYKWDLHHVRDTNEGWILFQLSKSEIEVLLNKEKIHFDKQGTLVLWDDLFLLDEEYNSYNEKLAPNFYFKTEENLILHLRMVFHRFIEQNKIKLSVNGDIKLSPWDPFCRKESKTFEIELPIENSHFKIKGYPKPVVIKAYILPDRESFSTHEAWNEAKGLLSWNDSQGYYIYRSDRIIRFGGWQGTRAKDEHNKLARLSIDINSELDRLFRITVNKAKVQFPESLFNHLKLVVNPKVAKFAQSRYRKIAKQFENKFRKQERKLNGISRTFILDNKIKTKINSTGNEIYVTNPAGIWLANKISEFLNYGSTKDFEVVSGTVEDGYLWKVLCHEKEKIKVVVNESHPFYKKLYTSLNNKNATNAVDALIFSLAFAELYNRNNQNAQLFDTFKIVCSQVLEKLINNEII